MASSIRKTIRQNLITALEAITTVNGYNFTVGLVTPRLLAPAELVGQAPAISVVTGIARKQASDESHVLWQCDTIYQIVGYFKVKTDTGNTGKLSDAADDLMEDIEERLIAAASGGELGTEVKWMLLQAEDPYLDYQNNYGEVGIVVAIRHYHEANL